LIKLIAFDLDNVLIEGEAIDEIGKLMGIEDEIMEITEKAMSGDLDFKTALKERVVLLKGASLEDIKKMIDEIPLVEGAEETIKELKKRGYIIATITGSFDIIANKIKDKLDLDYSFSNFLHEKDGILTGEVSGPLVDGTKGDVLKKIIKMENISLKECAAVGDGANDISMLNKAGLGIAFNAKPILRENADIIIDDKDLRELLPLFNKNLEDENFSNVSPIWEENLIKLLDEKKELENKVLELKMGREKLNNEAKGYRQLRDDLNKIIRENLNKAVENRDRRNKINAKVEKYKKMREQANKDFKNMEWFSGKRDMLKKEKEIKKLERTIETEVLDIKKENELVNKVNDLRKELNLIEENEKIRKKAYELKDLSESYHLKVVEFSQEAQMAHEEMIKSFETIDELRNKADSAHKKFLEFKEKSSKKQENEKAILLEIYKLNKNINKLKTKKRSLNSKIAEKENIKEKKLAEDIFQKFKNGKKLSTDELLLLQKHDVV
jgi:phosphoserine phosphatase